MRLKITFNSPVILGLVALSFGAFLLGRATDGMTDSLLFATYHSSLHSPLTYVRFFTYIFGHAGWEHLIGNMTYILLVGPLLEEKYGSAALAKMIFATAVITAVINFIFFPGIALCGASGICFAFILMSSLTGFREGEIPLTFILVAVIYFGQQFYEGLFVHNNVSNLGHVIGGVVGALSGLVFTRRRYRR